VWLVLQPSPPSPSGRPPQGKWYARRRVYDIHKRCIAMLTAAVWCWCAQLNYAQLFKAGGIAQVVSSPSGEFLDCNEMFSQMSGFPREEITKFTMFHLTPPSQLPSMYQCVLASRCLHG